MAAIFNGTEIRQAPDNERSVMQQRTANGEEPTLYLNPKSGPIAGMRQAIALIQGDFAGSEDRDGYCCPINKGRKPVVQRPKGIKREMAILERVIVNVRQPGGVTDPGPGFSHNFAMDQLDTSSL